MTSNKTSSPLSTIFQQWTAQIKNESYLSLSSPSYRILLQSTYSLKSRITAAEPVENLSLYKRAGLMTPLEQAFRDIHGATETAWLLRLVELAVQQQQQQMQKVTDSSGIESDTGSIIFLRTKTQPENNCPLQELHEDVTRSVKIIDVGSHGAFDLGKGGNGIHDERTKRFSNVNDVRSLFLRLREELNGTSISKSPKILICQSLTPLIAAHGFQNILRLFCALPSCLQVWPVNLQTITPKQHVQLEDASNSILHLFGGEMNMIRQGIRERGQVLRRKLAFRLEPIVSDLHQLRRYRVVEETDEEKGRIVDNDDHQTREKDEGNINKKIGIGFDFVDKAESKETSHMHGASRGAHLRLEENEGGRNGSAGRIVTSDTENASFSRPRIFLEDDDPEFDDFDEEDPDDDLDI